MIALDSLEQMDAKTFKLVGADACRDGLSGFIQIGFDFRIAKPPHGHARDGNLGE